MNFQDIAKIEKADSFLDTAFRAARMLEKPKIRDRVKAAKAMELGKMDTVRRVLTRRLSAILKSFPSLDALPDFYNELVKATTDYPRLKKSLGAVDWAVKRINILHKGCSLKVKKSNQMGQAASQRTQFYGRVSSVMKQISFELAFLDDARKTMRRYPAIKTSLFTVTVAGYPNVGKSSLLKALTGASPEIRSYAFTTKAINIGYLRHAGQRIQLVDTPGLFDRSIHDMNSIEKQAYLVLKYVADAIIFMIDPTGSCGYDVRMQQKLLKRIRHFGKRIVVLYSKADLLEKKEPGSRYISTKTREGIDSLVTLLAKHHKPGSKEEDNQH